MTIASRKGRIRTFTVNVCASLRLGNPLSVTRTVMLLVPACESAGVQVNTPSVAPILAPVGAPGSKPKVNGCGGGWGAAPAPFVVLAGPPPAVTVRFETAASTGGLLLANTVTLKV